MLPCSNHNQHLKPNLKEMKRLFAIMAIATIMTAAACNNSADSTAAAATADSIRIADSTARAIAIDDSIKATMETKIDSTKAVDSLNKNSVKTLPIDTVNKAINKSKMEATGK
jgi:hypothetical protein